MLLQDVFENRYKELRQTKDFDQREIDVLRLIIGEIQRRKNMNEKMEDREVIKKLEMLKFGEEENVRLGKTSDSAEYNIKYYEKFIPMKPTEEEIRNFITSISVEIPNPRIKAMGMIMKHFNNLADGNLVKSILMEE